MPYLLYFVNSTSIVSKSWLYVTAGSTWGVKFNLGQSSCYFDLRSSFQLDLPRSNNICSDAFRRAKHESWCLNESALFLSSEVIREKKLYISKLLLSVLFWPDLEGSRYDLRRSTRVPLNSERPKDSFSPSPATLCQLGAKWHGGGNCAF